MRASNNNEFAGEHIQLLPEGISLEELEKLIIQLALKKSGGNQTKAAKYLKTSRDTLRYRMKKFGLGENGKEEGRFDGEELEGEQIAPCGA
ncbi:sigma-54 dependent DNA-binding response regulator [Citrifermentans bremense]|uniref:Sigma-54 dependent DNA-binding response regulator n=1 Tax=Citrifermentans bremense TaxID=60035 RepID=A0A6S6M378_9BACT|nr:helix-turn-helix domain-containing protein [Citrifermentans bremense]BCG48183.1 sigma-54 dependent DNA-binding response regulator [Citrifermentans bremense]